jgi:hypothetical protein
MGFDPRASLGDGDSILSKRNDMHRGLDDMHQHWSIMEKLPKLERGGGNRKGTSPMMGKNDSEARKLRELSNGGDRTRFLFHRSWGRTAKNSLIELILEELKGIMERRRRSSPLLARPGRPAPAPATCARSGNKEEAEPPWFGSRGERNEGRGHNERDREDPAGPARQAGDVWGGAARG